MLRAPYPRFSSSGRKRQQAHEQTSSYGRSVQVHCCTLQHCSTGPARSATARRSAGSAAAALHTRTPPLLLFSLFFTGSSLPFFFLTSVQCRCAQCRCAQCRCTTVSASTQPCWCAARGDEAAAASPLPPPPPSFFSVLLQAAQQRARTEHSYNAAPSVLELQRCTSSARLPLQHTFHKKNL